MASDAMKHFLGMADNGQQGKGDFNKHALIPSMLQTQFQVIRNALFAAKAQVN